MQVISALLIATTLMLVGCGSDSEPATESGSTTPATPADKQAPTESTTASPAKTAGQGTVLTTADSEFGTMLFDDSGQAIYLFDKETSTQPECYQACAEAWPPVLTEVSPNRPSGEVRSDLVGTTERTDGSTQLTYAGHPLYYYAHEGKGEVLCHNVTSFGGLWLVITPSGEPAA